MKETGTSPVDAILAHVDEELARIVKTKALEDCRNATIHHVYHKGLEFCAKLREAVEVDWIGNITDDSFDDFGGYVGESQEIGICW
jgi:hypothetical protein